MLNLTQTAYWTRRLLKFGAIFIVAIIFLRIIFNIVSSVWQKVNPPAPAAPTVLFGKLPKLKFPENSYNGKTFTYRLETIQGTLPAVKTIAKVYFFPNERPSLLGLEKATQQAGKLGFKSEPQQISEKIYRWDNGQTPTTTLEININNNSFHQLYDYTNDQEAIDSKDLPTNQQTAQEAKSFLSSNGFLEPDLATGSADFVYLKYSPPDLNTVSSLSEANFIRVNLFRADLDELRILPPNPKKSLVSFLFSGIKTLGRRIIEVNYNYYLIDRETYSTYPLKSVQSAWQEFQQNQGFISNLGENENGNIIIRKVSLAYYDADEPQNFLQPIYVFEGDHDFIGFLPAIDSKWME